MEEKNYEDSGDSDLGYDGNPTDSFTSDFPTDSNDENSTDSFASDFPTYSDDENPTDSFASDFPIDSDTTEQSSAGDLCGANGVHDGPHECCIRPCILPKGHCATGQQHKCSEGHRWPCPPDVC
jgi:hypothetical protein